MKISAGRTAPVAGSVIATVLPEKSTNALSPATWCWRMVGAKRRSNARYSSQNRL